MTSNDVFLGGGSNSGSLINAELPNIIGDFQCVSKTTYGTSSANGAFYKSADVVSDSYTGGGANIYKSTYSFSASRSNSIYNGTKLIPKHYTIEFWIKFK